MQQLIYKLAVRWAVSMLGLWVAEGLLGSSRISVGHGWRTLAIAALVLALINMAIKPLLIFLALPAIILTLGLFMLVVNGLVILLASWIYNPLYVKSLGVAIVAGIIVGLVNYLVTTVLEDSK